MLFRSERFGDGLHHQRLGEPRHADEQGVAAREDRGENPIQDLPLPNNALTDLRKQVLARIGETLE